MAYSVKFRNAVLRDDAQPPTLEDAIRRTSAFAGIHDFDFRNRIDEQFANADNWTLDTADGTTWTASGTLLGTGGSGGLWYQARHSVEVSPSFVASFDLIGGGGGFVFCGRDDSTEAFMAWFTGTGCGFSRINADKTWSAYSVMPHGIVAPARIQVAVRHSLDSVDDERKWLLASLFVDGVCIAEMAQDVGDSAYDWNGNWVGFAVATGWTPLEVDNFTIPELKRITEWTTIEEGVSAAEGQSRAIGTTRVATMARYDGTLRCWMPGNRDLDWTADDDRQVQILDRTNITETATHVRTQGALYEMDAFYDAEGDVHGHRFILHNNPNLMGKDDSFEEAERVLHDRVESQFQVRFRMPPMTLLEPHDRIVIDGQDYRVLTLAASYTMDKDRPVISSEVQTRQYIVFDELDPTSFILREDGGLLLLETGSEMETEN